MLIEILRVKTFNLKIEMEVMKLAVDVELFIIIKSVSMKPKSYQLSFNQLFVIILIVQILSIIVVLMRM